MCYLTAATLAVPERLSERETGQCRRELDFCLRILHVFSSSILLIDEVDLILHPLRSELHWPIGRKQPLDYTTPSSFSQLSSSSSSHVSASPPSSSAETSLAVLAKKTGGKQPLFAASQIIEGLTMRDEDEERWRRTREEHLLLFSSSSSPDSSTSSSLHSLQHQPLSFLLLQPQQGDGRGRFSSQQGLRWQIPWILLDPFFFSREGRMTVPLIDSREAYTILYAIQQALDQGLAQRALLESPHLVLLNPRWYDAKLKSLLARWLLLVLTRIQTFNAGFLLTLKQTLLYMVRIETSYT